MARATIWGVRSQPSEQCTRTGRPSLSTAPHTRVAAFSMTDRCCSQRVLSSAESQLEAQEWAFCNMQVQIYTGTYVCVALLHCGVKPQQCVYMCVCGANEGRAQRERSNGSTYFPGSGIWLQTARRAWKLLRMAWMLAIPMNITSQLG